MSIKSIIALSIIALSITIAYSKDLNQSDTLAVQTEKHDSQFKHSIGSSLFLLGNIDTGDTVYFGQLNYGFRISKKHNILIEATTWTYYEPLGTYGNSDEMYPGKVRAYGVGVGLQRFVWKKVYTSAVVTPFLQQFYDSDDHTIQKGFQLYLQTILGYRIEFCKHRMFVEPAIAYKHWPVNTNVPSAFKDINRGTPNHIWEPSANFGYRF